MKKILSVILTLILCFSVVNVCFAAEGTNTKEENIVDNQNPLSPAQTTGTEEYTTANDESVPLGDATAAGNLMQVAEEETPKADALPKTGGIPAEAFYIVGVLLIGGAIVLSMRKAKPAAK
jgi:LPXTG-motif cell wall-anchored protein